MEAAATAQAVGGCAVRRRLWRRLWRRRLTEASSRPGKSQFSTKTPRPHVVLTSAVSLCTRWPLTRPIYTASPIPAAGIECCDCGLDRGDPVEIEAPRLVHTDTFVEIPEDALFAWLRHQ